MTYDDSPERLRRRLYEAYASTHAGNASDVTAAMSFRREIEPHLPAEKSADILDLGCGQGALVRQLIEAGFANTRGIDVSPEQVQKAHAAGVLQVSLGDYREMLGEAKLDVVTAIDFLEHFKPYEVLEILDRVGRALRADGTFILRVPNAASPYGGRYRYGDLTHETSFTASSLRQLASATDFSTITLHPCPPLVHGVKSAMRASLWKVAAALMKSALVAETGQVRGHVVTQNIVAVMRAA